MKTMFSKIISQPCLLRNFYFLSRSDFVTLPFQGAEVLLDNIAPLPGITQVENFRHLRI